MPTSMKNASPDTPGFYPWEDRHSETLITGIIDLVMLHKKELYRLPGLAGEVDGHGADRIRSKVEQILKKLAVDHGLSQGVVKGNGQRGIKTDQAAETKKRKRPV
ncbi:hypothetical protein BD324DRAFT_651081 [Kockovaella imperatae]|uniref:Uncharacterized protein n=1 Tax=Kockovaella imperatae TaxID=4999 RepID=A0A1Y1UEV7_9TREE|nr:hypothetical protein BD324DRAFT_651081 [Kockovaella imperatae]ORX36590.1 hypothetical protein BD324DRAFT_651081 [Kockovaella imperatae]